eukprot:3742467-Alexandrium_andersonii.AAC.1
MSASLVGSEMCIRDRCRLHSNCAAFTQVAYFSVSRRYASYRKPLLLRFPVSYTHLTLPTICSV